MNECGYSDDFIWRIATSLAIYSAYDESPGWDEAWERGVRITQRLEGLGFIRINDASGRVVWVHPGLSRMVSNAGGWSVATETLISEMSDEELISRVAMVELEGY